MAKAKPQADTLFPTEQPAAPMKSTPSKQVTIRKPSRHKLIVGVQQAEASVLAPALALLQTIERLSTNKDTNPEIVRILLGEMHNLQARQDRIQFDTALAEVQGELPIIYRRGKIVVRAKDQKTGERTGKVIQSTPYALYEDIVGEVLPILSSKGFSVSHITDTEGTVKVESVLSGYGHERRTKLTLMHDATGSKNSVQAISSSVSYAKRINLCSLLSIATRGEDDDGNAAGDPVTVGEPITPDQIAELVTYREAIGCPPKHFMNHLNATRPAGHPEIQGLDFLPASRFEEAKAALQGYDTARRKLEQERQANAATNQK